MAMILGTLQDAHGVSLFGRTWCQILDLNAAQAQALAAQAHREGLLNRGKDVPSAPWYKVFKGDRINDHHLTLAQKREARGA
jgi:hypothetical protein